MSSRRNVVRLGRLLLAGAPFVFLGAASAPKAARPHIILISIDTLRADHLGAYGYRPATTPFLDSLAAKGLLFENAYVPLPATGPSHASLLTSVRPWRHGVMTNGLSLLASVDTLAAAMKRAGYDTAGAVAVSHIGRNTGFARGFATFTDVPAPAETDRRDGTNINQDARAAIETHLASRAGRPLFLFLHYFDCHYPYRSWDRSETREDPWDPAVQARRDVQLRRYDDGVRHVDELIRRIYGYATARLGPNVILCVTADHGEQIGDHGLGVGHADIYRETVAVPLIIAGPEIPAARIDTPVSTMDVGVTLAAFAGAKFANPVDGMDLLATAERRTSWTQRLLGSKATRPFLVVGTPTYTRSVALIEGANWYIRNFDAFYRDAWVESPAPDAGKPATPVAGAAAEDGALAYRIPYHRYQPHLIAIEHAAKDRNCAMTAVPLLAPNVKYYDAPIAFKGLVRITVPAARLDSVTLLVAPARCAGQTSYRVRRIDDTAGISAKAYAQTSLFGRLYAARKSAHGDELFDATDTAMVRNRVTAAEARSLDARLRSIYESFAAAAMPNAKVPPEELRKLRSLGYIQ